jgi:ATP-binding cassette subfamily B protein
VLPLVASSAGRLRRRSRAAQDTLADASAYAAELIGAVRTLQAFTMRSSPPGVFADAVERAFRAACESTLARAILTAIGIFLVFASVVIVLWVGAQGRAWRTKSRRDDCRIRALRGVCRRRARRDVAGGQRDRGDLWRSRAPVRDPRDRDGRSHRRRSQSPLPAPSRGEVTFDSVRFA